MTDFFPDIDAGDQLHTGRDQQTLEGCNNGNNNANDNTDDNETEDGPVLDEQGRKHAPIMKSKTLKTGRKYVPEMTKKIVMQRLDLSGSEWNQVRGFVRTLFQTHRLDSRDRTGKIVGWSKRNASYAQAKSDEAVADPVQDQESCHQRS